MKKQALLTTMSLILLITGCSDLGHLNKKNNPIASLFEAYESSSSELITSGDNDSSSSSSDDPSYPVYPDIDIDLTTMNATMVYSQVYNMVYYPSEYINKIVKIYGPFVPYESTDPNYCYPAIVIQDATACCANGLEFLLYGVPRCSMSGGNGYPLYNEEATIVGRFETYLEGNYVYTHLVDAIWIK